MKDNKKEELELARKTPEFNRFGMMRRFTKDMERPFDDFGGFSFPGFFNREMFPFNAEFTEFDWMPLKTRSKPLRKQRERSGLFVAQRTVRWAARFGGY